MKFPETNYPHAGLTNKVIAAGFAVHSELGPGLSEKIYENALCVEFAIQEIYFSQQQDYPVHYKNRFVGKLIPDLVVDNKIIVDAKVVDELNKEHQAQILSYLAITKLEIGILLNFKKASLEIKRLANLKKNQC